MYLRFVRPIKLNHMAARSGFFTAAYELRDQNPDPLTSLRLEKHLAWFRENLHAPAKFTRSKSKGAWRVDDTKGLSWFKDTATEMLAQAHDLAALLNECGHPIEVLRSDRIGYIVYADLHQVIAEPFSDTPT
ncbi:MAG: hypothetical protein U1A24_04130 [Cypionkella sp.]|uniref:hypothetical protein n=1 Tax=Cypionkella sp. TaxID=2811411 RepID=UPI002AB8FC81|nr:hypothetical protein [Cypionkella sp.]MDZ4309733.1 hypothetical protein [Cypionkella sp.]